MDWGFIGEMTLGPRVMGLEDVQPISFDFSSRDLRVLDASCSRFESNDV